MNFNTVCHELLLFPRIGGLTTDFTCDDNSVMVSITIFGVFLWETGEIVGPGGREGVISEIFVFLNCFYMPR